MVPGSVCWCIARWHTALQPWHARTCPVRMKSMQARRLWSRAVAVQSMHAHAPCQGAAPTLPTPFQSSMSSFVPQALGIVEQSVATQAMDPNASTPHMHQVRYCTAHGWQQLGAHMTGCGVRACMR